MRGRATRTDTFKTSQFNGYQEAEQIDQQINTWLEQYPITNDNCGAWLKFARTILTTVNIITEAATPKVDGKLQAAMTKLDPADLQALIAAIQKD